MTSPLREPTWKRWLDRALMLDTLVVIIGAVWFAVAAVALDQHLEKPMALFQLLWGLLFLPAIGILILASLFSGLWDWWQRLGLQANQDGRR